MKKRILLCLGTRAEAVKLCPLYLALVACKDLDTYLFCSGQHTEMADSVLGFFGVRADISLNIMKESQSPEYIVETLTQKMPKLLAELAPDILLVHGDTATALGAALAARQQGIVVGHIEAGLRSGNDASPYPEEIYRKRISALSSLHFSPTVIDAENLRREGIEDNVYVTGNTVIDALLYAKSREDCASDTVKRIDYSSPVMLLTCHRRENIKGGMREIFSAVKRLLIENDKLRILYPIHKNPKIREIFKEAHIDSDRLILTEPLDYPSFVYAMTHCKAIISDSGGIAEEACYLSVPCIIPRDTTERDMAIKHGCAMLVGADRDEIYKSAQRLLSDADYYTSLSSKRYEYGDGKASERITKILASL